MIAHITCTIDDTHVISQVYELVCWFDFDFTGQGGTVTVSTAPAAKDTHWHQTNLVLKSELLLGEGVSGKGSMQMDVNEFRGYDITVDIRWSDGQKTQQVWHMSQKV